jgi:D-alanyl-D-alanine carboxypeptidase/D-alanyl-D-alanine-endopeptidase (penicillin-binding protein 4)
MRSPSRCRGRACSALLAALLLSGCHASARPVTTARLSSVQQLQHDIDAILAAPALDHSVWGVLVKSLAKPDDDPIYSVHARTLLMPASNMKIVTLAATAARLGWDFHYETRIIASGPIQGGVLHGDLVIVGSGDPSIGSRDGSATHVFEAWADNLKALGLRRGRAWRRATRRSSASIRPAAA